MAILKLRCSNVETCRNEEYQSQLTPQDKTQQHHNILWHFISGRKIQIQYQNVQNYLVYALYIYLNCHDLLIRFS